MAARRALAGLDPTASPGGENREVGGLGVGCGAVQAAIEAADFLSTFVDWGLESFHVGVSVELDGSITAETFSRMAEIETSPQSRSSVSLYHLCCLELYNHIVEGATYRTCENETCRRTFVRQEGRADTASTEPKASSTAQRPAHAPKPNEYCTAENVENLDRPAAPRTRGQRARRGLEKASPARRNTSSPGTVRDLVAGSGLEFSALGQHGLKGLPGT